MQDGGSSLESLSFDSRDTAQGAELGLTPKLEMQKLQGEMRELQGVLHNFETELQWIAEGGDTQTQRLQAEMEDLRAELRLHSEVQSSMQRLQDQAQKLQGPLSPEIQPGSHMIIHGLHSRADLNGMFGMVGDFDDSKARWAVKTGRGRAFGSRVPTFCQQTVWKQGSH